MADGDARKSDGDASRALSEAAAEGLELVKASNMTGYKGVSAKGKTGAFLVRARKQGIDYDLGTFWSAEEAALAYARFIGVEESHKQAGRFAPARRSGFGMPCPRTTVAAAVECEVVSDDDTTTLDAATVVCVRGGTASSDAVNDSTGGAVDEGCTSSRPCELSGASPSQKTALRRKRAIHEEVITEEYDLQAADDAVTLPVPSAMRGRACSLTIVYKVART
jgi:hypothetical protein